MVAPFWVYTSYMSTPLYIREVNKLIHALAGVTGNGMVEICCGYDVYSVNAKVINVIANNFLTGKPTIVSYSGESYTIETQDDVLSFLRKTKPERFYVDGDIIKSLTGAIK